MVKRLTRHMKKMNAFTATSQFCQTPSNKGLLTIIICCADTLFFPDEMECWGRAERYCDAVSALTVSVRRENVISLDLQHIIHYHVLTHVTWWDRSQITYRHLCYPVVCVHDCSKCWKIKKVWHLRLQGSTDCSSFNTHLDWIAQYKPFVGLRRNAAY